MLRLHGLEMGELEENGSAACRGGGRWSEWERIVKGHSKHLN